MKIAFFKTLNWKKIFALSPSLSLGRGWRKLQWVGGSLIAGVEKREEEERTARWTLAEIDNVCVVFVCRCSSCKAAAAAELLLVRATKWFLSLDSIYMDLPWAE